MKIKCPDCRRIAHYDVRDGSIECRSDACQMRRWKFGHRPYLSPKLYALNKLNELQLNDIYKLKTLKEAKYEIMSDMLADMNQRHHLEIPTFGYVDGYTGEYR